MKNFVRVPCIFFTLAFVVTSQNILSQSQTHTQQSSSDTATFSRIFIPDVIQFAFGFTHLDYKESVPSPLKSTENGILPGFNAGVSTKKYYSINLSAGIKYFTGNEDYDGTLQNGEPKKATTGSTFFQFVLGAEHVINISDNISLIPYLTFSYRSWDRQLGKGENGSYTELYKWYTLPYRCRIEFQMSDKISFGLDACQNPMLSGSILIHMSQINSMLPNIETNLGSKSGYRIMIPLQYQINDQWTFNMSPYYEQYSFGESKKENIIVNGQVVGNVMEPSSDTNMYGVTIAAVLHL